MILVVVSGYNRLKKVMTFFVIFDLLYQRLLEPFLFTVFGVYLVKLFLLLVNDPMSEPAMPLAPKLACRTVSLGAAPAVCRNTNGAVRPAAIAPRAERRVIGLVGFISISLRGELFRPQCP